MSSLAVRPAEECRFDFVALGEIMLRLDPEWDASATRGSSGSGKGVASTTSPAVYAAASAPHRSRHRLCRQLGGAARGLRPAGRRRHVLRPLGRLGRHRSYRPQRAQFHRRGFGVRGAWGCPTRANTAASQLRLGDVDWEHLFGTSGALVPYGRDLRGALGDDAGVVAGGVDAAASHGTVVSYDLNYRPSL